MKFYKYSINVAIWFCTRNTKMYLVQVTEERTQSDLIQYFEKNYSSCVIKKKKQRTL